MWCAPHGFDGGQKCVGELHPGHSDWPFRCRGVNILVHVVAEVGLAVVPAIYKNLTKTILKTRFS